jgi:hypothetical protein
MTGGNAETFEVGEYGAAFFHRRHDRREVVIRSE